jgi:hypothetical protein
MQEQNNPFSGVEADAEIWCRSLLCHPLKIFARFWEQQFADTESMQVSRWKNWQKKLTFTPTF